MSSSSVLLPFQPQAMLPGTRGGDGSASLTCHQLSGGADGGGGCILTNLLISHHCPQVGIFIWEGRIELLIPGRGCWGGRWGCG